MSSIVVIGANGGIGFELCQQLVAGGHRVTLAGRNEASLKRCGEQLDAPFRMVDATSIESVDACLRNVAEATGSVDGVVNCVGSILLKPAHLITSDDWHETIATNLTSAFATVRGAVQVMRRQGGSIVLFSSAAARIGLPNHEAIAAAKAGVIGLAQSAAASYASRNIRVNVIAPGLVRTPLTERIWSKEAAAEASRSMHALGRFGEPADIASLAAWLMDSRNTWVTGQVFGVDGGLATLRTN